MWIFPGSLGVFLLWDWKKHPYDPIVQNMEEEPRSPFSRLALEPNNGKMYFTAQSLEFWDA